MRPELPTASVGSSQATTAAVDNSAPSATRPKSTYKSGNAVQTNGATSAPYALAIFLGSALSNATDASFTVLTAVGLALANASGALAGRWLVCARDQYSLHFKRVGDYFRFMALGGFGAAATSALLGVLTLHLSAGLPAQQVGYSILHWWMGDSLGIAMVAPLILVWREWPATQRASPKVLEGVMLALLAFLVGQIVYFGWFGATAGTVVGHYWMFLIVAWVAVRLGVHGVVLVLMMGAVQGVLGSYQSEGMFASDAVQAPQLNFWFFLLLLSTVGISLAVHFTEHQELTDELLAAKKRQDAMLDAIPDLMFEVALDGRIHKVHAPVPDMLVAPASVLLKSTLLECMPQPAADTAMNSLLQANLKGHSTGNQFELTLSGVRMWFELSVERMEGIGDAGNPHFIMLSRDITSSKQAQEDLRVSAIAFDSEEGIVVLDAQRQALRVNRAFTRLTGYAAEEVLGKPVRKLRSPRHAESFYADIWKTVADSGRWQGEVWMRHKSGEEMAIWGTLTAVRDEQGNVTHYVRTMTDVTHLKFEEDIRRSREAGLREALVREVHHRIKNNLQGVNGVLRQFALRHPEIATPINQAIAQVQSIAAIHGLQGRTGLGDLSLQTVLQEVASGVSATWHAPIAQSVDPDCAGAMISQHDAVPLALVINELLSNAVKHGGEKANVRVDLSVAGASPQSQFKVVLQMENSCSETLAPAAPGGPDAGLVTTGLSLVSALLPPQGAHLEQQVQEGIFVSRLELEPPAIAWANEEPT